MIFDITRLTDLAGQDFTSPKCRVRSPHITARERIEIGNYIVGLERVVRQQQVYIDHALDNSKEQLVKRITEIENSIIKQEKNNA